MNFNSTCIQNSSMSFFAEGENKLFSGDKSKTIISKYLLKDFFYKEYTMNTIEDVDFILNNRAQQGLYFLFCWQGKFNISIPNVETKNINDYQSALVYDSQFEGVTLKLKKRLLHHFCVIGFNQQLDFENSSYSKCRDAFYKKVNSNLQIFIGQPYFKLIKYVDKISKRVKENQISELIIVGLIYQIIGLKLEHLIQTSQNQQTTEFKISSEELKRIHFIANKIKKNPSFEYTIEYLCKQTALSPFKLQEGFKKLHHATAMDYVRDSRLEKALELIKTSDISISEVVYSIGLTSRSYFSKIFKERYKCSPRVFKKQYHLKMSNS